MRLTLGRDLLLGFGRLSGEEAQDLSEVDAVLGALVNSMLQVLAERVIELGELLLALGDLAQEVHALLDNVLAIDRTIE